jgi:hypothetical protein
MRQIYEALTRCDWFAVVLCADSLSSVWLDRELKYVVSKRRFDNKIIPLLLENDPEDYEPLAFFLPKIQYIDSRADFDAGCRALLRVWGLGYVQAPNI